MRFLPKRTIIPLCGSIIVAAMLVIIFTTTGVEEDHAKRQYMRSNVRRLSGINQLDDIWKMAPIQKAVGDIIEIDESKLESRVIDEQLVRGLKFYLDRIDASQSQCPFNETLAEYWHRTRGETMSRSDSWERFYANIGNCELYREEKLVQNLLDDMHFLPIRTVEIMDTGTQVKLLLTFNNGKRAVFKPMRFGRNYETDPNHFYFSDFERHHAEIAAFHLDKVLGFRRAIPTVGRIVNISSELFSNAESSFRKTFFISPAKNLCFVSKCDYYCDTTHAICGSPDLKEGSVQVFLPDKLAVPRRHLKSPYRRQGAKIAVTEYLSI